MPTAPKVSGRPSALDLPQAPDGFRKVMKALRARPPLRSARLPAEPPWRSRFVAPCADVPRVSLREFGYRDDELLHAKGRVDDTAVAGPWRLLTDEGLERLAAVCERLEVAAQDAGFTATRRLRAADLLSPFLANMIRDREFLLTCSRLVGIPLIPHPLRLPTAQINYGEGGGRQGGVRWHRDGMDYVFTIQLSGYDDYDGGRFTYFRGRTDEFPGPVPDDSRFHEADLGKRGATLFLHGSRIFHAVTPVTKGHRVTLVISLFCPYFARQDSNTFWHLAADDGIAATVPCWLRLKWPVRNPAVDFGLRSASPVITWDDLR
ncbi:2OG-Fe(II) oxygenase [Streptomyces roseoverticillatus]|uniref:2OG-Fe(II) oxygenase n=1 Tax=Streptomyces roseoverticillatus TaxID=66429 RepID=UPI001F468D00|nr:2OG-Fe(II) oxygenase [Streptomyces roseoverticillatus]MCF3101706.1 2OG-Fe(II) oxygenase [Streptomyces roseoverticillatus]